VSAVKVERRRKVMAANPDPGRRFERAHLIHVTGPTWRLRICTATPTWFRSAITAFIEKRPESGGRVLASRDELDAKSTHFFT
jgi:hypothetical protein